MYLRTYKSKSKSDADRSTQEGTSTPHEHDVLCGRGGGSKNHKGNINFRQIVEANRKLYASSSKERKRVLARSIVETIQGAQSPGGRFLEKAKDGLWYELCYEAAVEKTKQSLREARCANGGKCKKGKKRTSVESKAANIAKGSSKRQKSVEPVVAESPVAEKKSLIQFAERPTGSFSSQEPVPDKPTSEAQSENPVEEANMCAAPSNAAPEDTPVPCDVKTESNCARNETDWAIPKYALNSNAELPPTLARITSTLGSLMKKGPFLPSQLFDDETEKRLLAEYGISQDTISKHIGPSTSAKKNPLAPPAALEDQFSLTLSMEDTQLLSQISRAISLAYYKARTGDQASSDEQTKADTTTATPSAPDAQSVPLSPDETCILKRMSTLTLAAHCQGDSPWAVGAANDEKPSSGKHDDAPPPPALASRTSSAGAALSPEETRLLSQISVLSFGDGGLLGPTARMTGHIRSLGGMALADLLADADASVGEAEGKGKGKDRCGSTPSLSGSDLAKGGTATEAAPCCSSGQQQLMIQRPSNMCSARSASECSCTGSLLDEDDLDTAAVARLRRMS